MFKVIVQSVIVIDIVQSVVVIVIVQKRFSRLIAVPRV